MGFPVLPYDFRTARSTEAAGLEAMVLPFTPAETARIKALQRRLRGLGSKEKEATVLSQLPPNPNPSKSRNGKDIVEKEGNEFTGLDLQHYMSRSGTAHHTCTMYLKMLCAYVNNRVNRGDSVGRRNVPFVALVDISGRGKIDRMGVVRKLNVERVSRDMTENMLAYLPDLRNPTRSSQFFRSQHIFIPCRFQHPWPTQNDEHAIHPHVALIVISPRSRTVDFLDSLYSANRNDKHPEIIGNIFRLLAHHLGSDFRPSEWRMRVGASIQQEGHELWCVQAVQSNALAVAMGYDVKALRGMDWTLRRRRTMMELLTASFSDDANSSTMFYGSTGRTPTNSRADDFFPLTDQVMGRLELPARARTGIYDSMSVDELTQHCVDKNTEDLAAGAETVRYDGIREWKAQGLKEFISLVEQADWKFDNPGEATEPDLTPASPTKEMVIIELD